METLSYSQSVLIDFNYSSNGRETTDTEIDILYFRC